MPASDLDAFMATMIAPSVPISCGDAEKFARELYGMRTTAARLTGERGERSKPQHRRTNWSHHAGE